MQPLIFVHFIVRTNNGVFCNKLAEEKMKKPVNTAFYGLLVYFNRLLSGRQDSNLRPPGPKPGAITGLHYAPNYTFVLRSLSCLFCNLPAEAGRNNRAAHAPNFYFFIPAERVGFEPTVQFNPYDDLANRSFRPLRHLSGLPLRLF